MKIFWDCYITTYHPRPQGTLALQYLVHDMINL